MGKGSLRGIVTAVVVAVVVAGALFYGRLRIRPPVRGSAALAKARLEKRLPAAEAKLQAELRRIRAAKQPTTIQEIEPPPVPDAENAAPLYEKAYAATSLNTDEIHTIERLFRPALNPEPEGSVGPSRAIIAKNRQAIALVYQATERPQCRLAVEWERGNPAIARHIHVVGHLCFPVVGTAVLHAMDGDVPGGLRALRVGIRLGDALTEEPTQPLQDARYTTYRFTLEALLAVLSAHRVTPDLAKPLYDQLAAIEIMESFARGLIGDRARAFADYQKNQSMGLRSPENVFVPPEWTLEASEWLPLMGERIALADQPYRAVPKELEALDLRARRFEHTTDMIGQQFFPSERTWATAPFQQRDTVIAQIGLAQMALALKAYQAQHGGYPDSLGTLRSAVGWKIPGDPFSGRDFGYKRDGSAAVFYSIGPDLRDNGGTPQRRMGVPGARPQGTPTPGAPQQRVRTPERRGERPGDIVWRLRA